MPGPRRSSINSTHATRRVEASLVPATSALPYCNHPTLAAHTMVRSKGWWVPRRATSLQPTSQPFVAPSTKGSGGRLLLAPTKLIEEIPNHAGTRRTNATAPVTAAQRRPLREPDNRKMRPTARRSKTSNHGRTHYAPERNSRPGTRALQAMARQVYALDGLTYSERTATMEPIKLAYGVPPLDRNKDARFVRPYEKPHDCELVRISQRPGDSGFAAT